VAALPRVIKIKTVKILSGTQLFLDFFSNNSVFHANTSLRFVTDWDVSWAPKRLTARAASKPATAPLSREAGTDTR
jgi:hypothetical protein